MMGQRASDAENWASPKHWPMSVMSQWSAKNLMNP